MITTRIILTLMLITTHIVQAQRNTNCATNLAHDYFIKMGISDSTHSQEMPIMFNEVLTTKELESQANGVFIVSNLNAHRKKLILLKKGNEFKLLTFSDVSKSLRELLIYLDDINTGDEDLFKYLEFITAYVESSKSKIKVEKTLLDSDWISCK